MATDNEDGGPAFPKYATLGTQREGLSIRDWFAGQALARLSKFFVQEKYDMASDEIAEAAYVMADSMLSERGGPRP